MSDNLEELYKSMSDSIVDGDMEKATGLANKAVADGLDLLAVMENGYTAGIQKVGTLWEQGEYFLPELMRGAEIMKGAMGILLPHITKDPSSGQGVKKVVIGTVAGDIHDIGKTIVGTMLAANGFDVEDLGSDVPLEKFVEKVKEGNADLVCLSALLTTTMNGQKTVVDMLAQEGLRSGVKVMVGGAPVTDEWSKECGADGFGENAIAAVDLAKQLLG